MTVTVPFAIRKRGGKKLVITPDGTAATPAPRARVDSALLKALARGFRWRKLLEAGDFATIEEIAGSSPIVVGNKLLVNVGGSRGGAGVVAFDVASGKTVWQAVEDAAIHEVPRLEKNLPVLATVGSHAINGVAALHSELLKEIEKFKPE